MRFNIIVIIFVMLGASLDLTAAKPKLFLYGDKTNDLYIQLTKEKIPVSIYSSIDELVNQVNKNDAVLITAPDYPDQMVNISPMAYRLLQSKKVKVYIEYPSKIPGYKIDSSLYIGKLERGVVCSDFFGQKLPKMSLFSVNDCHIRMIQKVQDTLLCYAKVAGYDHAEYGLTNTKVYPLLFKDKNIMIATSCLSDFFKARYGPKESMKFIWENIIAWLIEEQVTFNDWSSDPTPSYAEKASLPANARKNSVSKGCEWFFNGRFFVHPSWKETWLKYQSDGSMPVGPSVDKKYLIGNGSLGIIEGHASNIYWNGDQQYRYWMRADVQGEVAFALASASELLNNEKYKEIAENLVDYLFYTSKFRAGERNNKNSSVYGLLGWSDTHPYVFYNDDNARAILGAIGASAYLDNERWNTLIVENILANFRTCSKQGFQGGRLDEGQIEKNGWKHFYNRDYTNPHPHFESWMWACYLWLYHKTGYQPLLDKAKTGIRIMMEAYPDKWNWTNGIQQERARMVLCLSWLVRVDDTPQHREWLDVVVQKLLKNQQPNGAIREELGNSSGMFGNTKSNEEYGLHEAPLIAANGDPVSDMLYTCNFAFFGLNEASHATNNPQYKEAVRKLSDFLTRVQVKSDAHTDLDGAWFRAFDYNRWDYWASNADAGWGAWSTLTGWIQSWIVGTQVLVEKDKSYWDVTQKMDLKKAIESSIWMLD